MRNSLKLALLLPLFALMAPTGGFPSRPTLQALNVGIVPGSFPAPITGTIQISRAAVPTTFMYDQSGAANSHYGRVAWTGGATSVLSLGSCPDNLSGCNDFLTLGGAGFTITSVAGTNNNSILFAPAGKFSQFRVETGSTASEGGMCVSDTIALCAAGDAANDVSFFGTGVLHFQNVAGTDFLTLSSTTVQVPAGSALKIGTAQVFTPVAVVLASDSVKSSTTTQALDATLQLTIPGAGTYMVELNGAILPAGIAAAAGGFAGCLQYSGTIAVLSAGTYSAALYVTNVAFSNQWLVEQTITTSCTGGSQVVYTSQTVGGTFDQLAWRGVLTTSTGGTFGLSWAQSSSSATPTTLKQGMVLSATRIL